MDDKTDQLRDIFVDVAGEEEVTEHQDDDRGSLATETDVEDDLRSTIETMRERYDFRTSLPVDDLARVVRGFYDDESDAEIARAIDADRKTVTRARIDLHLVTEADRDAPFDLDALEEQLEDGRSVGEMAETFDVSESTVRRYRHVLEVEEERRLASDRFRNEFERLLTDAELSERLTDEVKESGLEEAAEDIETDVSL